MLSPRTNRYRSTNMRRGNTGIATRGRPRSRATRYEHIENSQRSNEPSRAIRSWRRLSITIVSSSAPSTVTSPLMIGSSRS